MELWLDTLNLDIIKEASHLGILTGVTTNPSILSQTDSLPEVTIKRLLDIQPGYVAAQVVATKLDGIMAQAKKLAQLDKRMIIKIPAYGDGFRAIGLLKKENISTMATTIFEPRQIFFSAIAGAKYAAPYYGRIEKIEGNADSVLMAMQDIIRKQNSPLKILAAAIYSPAQLLNCTQAGVAAATIPEKVYNMLFESSKVIDNSLEEFENAWQANTQCRNSKFFS